MQAYAVARVTRTIRGTLDPELFLTKIAAVLFGFSPTGARRGMQGAHRSVIERVAEVGDLLDADPATAQKRLIHKSSVLSPADAGLWAFLTHLDDPQETLAVAAGLHPTSSTVTAVAGALSGAYLGDERLECLPPVDAGRRERMRRLGEALHRRFVGGAKVRQPSGWPRRPLGELFAAVELDIPRPPVEAPSYQSFIDHGPDLDRLPIRFAGPESIAGR